MADFAKSMQTAADAMRRFNAALRRRDEHIEALKRAHQVSRMRAFAWRKGRRK